MSRKTTTTTIGVIQSVDTTVDVDFDVEISDLSDDELMACVDEARERGLLGVVAGPVRDRLAPIYDDLLCRRTDHALARFEAAIFSGGDADMLEAHDALKRGSWSEAIVYLDKVIFGPPASAMLKPKEAESLLAKMRCSQ